LVSKAVLFFVFILPSLWLFFQAEARVSFVSLLLALTITLWVMKKRILILPVVILLLIWGIFFSGLGGRYSRTLDLYWEKIRNVLLKSVRAQVPEESMPKKIRRMQDARSKTPIVEQVSIEIRLVAEWPRAIRAFAKNPLLGTGYSSIGLATDNDYLRLLGEVGLAGTLAFLLVLIRLLTKIVFFLRKTAELDFNYAFVAGFFGGCIGFLTNASLIDVFEASKTAIYFWTLSGICTIAIKEGKNG
jgi:hypothetical protein